MKTIKNTNSFYVLGVKFENIQEEYCRLWL